MAQISIATPERIFQIGELLRRGVSIEAIHGACRIDPWFIDQMAIIIDERAALDEIGFDGMDTACVPPGQAPGVLRRPTRVPVGHRRVGGPRRP